MDPQPQQWSYLSVAFEEVAGFVDCSMHSVPLYPHSSKIPHFSPPPLTTFNSYSCMLMVLAEVGYLSQVKKITQVNIIYIASRKNTMNVFYCKS
jgi:hypothetical protein